MIDAIGFWKENRRTFGARERPWDNRQVVLYYALVTSISFILAIISGKISTDLLNSLMTAVSILVGFSFNALIFFVDHRFSIVSDSASLEQQSRQIKIDRLANASFSILYYFNFVAFVLVACCVLALAMPSLVEKAPLWVSRWFYITEAIGRAILFTLVAESVVTFLRVIRRLRFLFGKVREAQQ